VWSKEQAPNLKQFLDLVALGTVADSMPLQGTNRILVRAGMEIMATATRPGIQALLEQAEICRTTGAAVLSSEDIVFKLAPRINAAGRMGRADTAVHLLLANETKKARKAAAELELINAERKAKQDEITQQAESQYKNEAHRQKNMVVLYNRDWHIGVIGIVAARIAELCGLPVIVLADDPEQQGVVKGSGRGMPGTGSLYEEIKKCSDLLLGYGGHSQAIGLRLQKKNIKPLIEKLNTTPETNKINTKEYRQNIIELDDIDDVVDEDFLSLLCLFEPFGMANPEPVFACRAVKGMQAVILKEKHVRFTVSVKRARAYCEAIAFNQAQQYEALANQPVDLCFRVKKNSFRGQERVQLVVEKITISD
jgi:single-stranded-DNA-specific exonuclease